MACVNVVRSTHLRTWPTGEGWMELEWDVTADACLNSMGIQNWYGNYLEFLFATFFSASVNFTYINILSFCVRCACAPRHTRGLYYNTYDVTIMVHCRPCISNVYGAAPRRTKWFCGIQPGPAGLVVIPRKRMCRRRNTTLPTLRLAQCTTRQSSANTTLLQTCRKWAFGISSEISIPIYFFFLVIFAPFILAVSAHDWAL